MKVNIVLFFSFLILLFGCNKKPPIAQTLLEKTFSCNTEKSNAKTLILNDVKNNFSISLPKSWKANYFFDEYQSDIFAADTTKALSDSYIINASWNYGELQMNQEFVNRIVFENANLQMLFSEFENFKDKPSYWCLMKGVKNELEYQILNLYIQNKLESYILVSVEIYGNDNIEKRICESITHINTLEF